MQEQVDPALVRVLVQVVDPARIERARLADQAVHLIALFEQQLGQVRPVLPGDPGYQRLLCHVSLRCPALTYGAGDPS